MVDIQEMERKAIGNFNVKASIVVGLIMAVVVGILLYRYSRRYVEISVVDANDTNNVKIVSVTE